MFSSHVGGSHLEMSGGQTACDLAFVTALAFAFDEACQILQRCCPLLTGGLVGYPFGDCGGADAHLRSDQFQG
jgi:hypothetical protein